MYRFSKEQVMDPEFLTKLITHFKNTQVPRFRKLERYYRVQNEILMRTMDAGKPNNRLAHGFAKYISNMATSYFMGKPVRYVTDGDEEFKDALNSVLKNSYINSLNFELAKEASKKGMSAELIYVDEQADIRSKKLSADEFIPVYGVTVDEFLECVVRIWSDCDMDGKLLCEHAAVYTDRDTVYYQRTNEAALFGMVDAEGHGLDDLPVILYWNNEECTGDYEDVIPLIDAYDTAQSDTGNDMEYFTDAYLCIAGASGGLEEMAGVEGNGADGEEQKSTVQSLRENRILFLDEKGQAEWLTKNINDTAVENYKNRLYGNIFFLSQVPALSDDSFAGNLTGIAIKYKLIGLEELAIMKENRFEAAQQKKTRIITGFLNRKMNKNFDPDMVSRKYERNFIENVADMIENARNLEGIVSHETQMNQLPRSVVEDAADEMKKMLEEQRQEQEIPRVDLAKLMEQDNGQQTVLEPQIPV